MKKLTIALGVAMTGCLSSEPQETIDEYIPIHVVEKVLETCPEELKKGPEPGPGRVIDYKGHGTGYSGHAQHHYHMRQVHGHE
jgi:hypothetical protein